jgi:C1q domain
MTINLSPNPLAYTGINTEVNPGIVSVDRPPNSNDWQSFEPGNQWIDTSITPPDIYECQSVSGNQGTWVNLSSAASAVSQLTGNSGIATEVSGNINVLGSGNITTSGSGDTLTTSITGIIPVDNGGTGASTLTIHDVIVGNGTSPVTLVPPSATSGIPLISQGSSSDPTFGIATVPGGGTGVNSWSDLNSVLCTGTTMTGNLQSITSGVSGTVLTSNGVNVIPSWQATTSSGAAFSAYLSGNQSNVTGDGTIYQIPFDLVNFDDTGGFNTGTGIFTAQVDGVYLFNSVVSAFNFLTTDLFEVLFYYNTSVELSHMYYGSPASITSQLTSITYKMIAGDTMEVLTKVSGTTLTIAVAGGSNFSNFCGSLLYRT